MRTDYEFRDVEIDELRGDLVTRGVITDDSDISLLPDLSQKAILDGARWFAHRYPHVFDENPLTLHAEDLGRKGVWITLGSYMPAMKLVTYAEGRYGLESFADGTHFLSATTEHYPQQLWGTTIHELVHHAQARLSNDGWEFLFSLQRIEAGDPLAPFPEASDDMRRKVAAVHGDYAATRQSELGPEALKDFAYGKLAPHGVAVDKALDAMFGPQDILRQRTRRKIGEFLKSDSSIWDMPHTAIGPGRTAMNQPHYGSGVKFSQLGEHPAYARTSTGHLYKLTKTGVIDVTATAATGEVVMLPAKYASGVEVEVGFPLKVVNRGDLVADDQGYVRHRIVRPETWDLGQVVEVFIVHGVSHETDASKLLSDVGSSISELVQDVEGIMFEYERPGVPIAAGKEEGSVRSAWPASEIRLEDLKRGFPYATGMVLETSEGEVEISSFGYVSAKGVKNFWGLSLPDGSKNNSLRIGAPALFEGKDGERFEVAEIRRIFVDETLPLSTAALKGIMGKHPVPSVATQVADMYSNAREVVDVAARLALDPVRLTTIEGVAGTRPREVAISELVSAEHRLIDGSELNAFDGQSVYVRTNDGGRYLIRDDRCVDVVESIRNGIETHVAKDSLDSSQVAEVIAMWKTGYSKSPCDLARATGGRATDLVQEIESSLLAIRHAASPLRLDEESQKLFVKVNREGSVEELGGSYPNMILETEQGPIKLNGSGIVVGNEYRSTNGGDGLSDVHLSTGGPFEVTLHDGSVFRAEEIREIWREEDIALSPRAIRETLSGQRPTSVSQAAAERFAHERANLDNAMAEIRSAHRVALPAAAHQL